MQGCQFGKGLISIVLAAFAVLSALHSVLPLTSQGKQLIKPANVGNHSAAIISPQCAQVRLLASSLVRIQENFWRHASSLDDGAVLNDYVFPLYLALSDNFRHEQSR